MQKNWRFESNLSEIRDTKFLRFALFLDMFMSIVIYVYIILHVVYACKCIKRGFFKMNHHSADMNYRKTSNISRTLVGNKIVDNSDVVGASPVGAAPTTSSFSTLHLASMDWAKTTARGDKKHLSFAIWCDLY